YFYLAINDINHKKYDDALEKLSTALTVRNVGAMEGYEGLTLDKVHFYKVLGDAYSGLQQYEKARDNYNIALLIDPDDESSQMAIAKLESVVAKVKSSD